MKFFSGLILGVLVAIAVPLALIWTGNVDMSATQKPGRLERRIGNLAWSKSMEKRAVEQENPLAHQPGILKNGLAHYRENCVVCHGAPGVERAEIGKGLNPAPPRLDSRGTQKMKDAQLFYVIKNGIRMTGMPGFGPTHSDNEIWALVAFVRHLPALAPSEKQELQAVTQEEEQHHHEGEMRK